MEKLHIPVDCIVGTSMGALIGGMYAAGVSPDEIERKITQANVELLFNEDPPRAEIPQNIRQDDYRSLFEFAIGFNNGEFQLPAGASAGYKFELFLKEVIGPPASISNMNFDDLPIPYRAIATDLETGEPKMFGNGELTRVMRASMSLPAIVAPIIIDERMYVDGGLVRNLPVQIAKQLCGNTVVAVNLGTQPKSKSEINTSIDVALQSIVLLTEQNVKKSLVSLGNKDILLSPNLKDFDSSSFGRVKDIVKRGVEVAQANQELLLTLSSTETEYKNWIQKINNRKARPNYTITHILAETSNTISPETILQDINVERGKPLDTNQLHKDIIDLFGRGDFSYLGYSIVPNEDNATLIINTQSKGWGPGYLKFGFGAITDFTNQAQLNLTASHRQTWINSLGAEWQTNAQIGYNTRLTTTFLQPLQIRDGAFIAPYIGADRDFVQFFDKHVRLGEVEIKRAGTGLDIGISGKSGELVIGPFYRYVVTEPDFGVITPLLEKENFWQSGVKFTAIYDQVDRLPFPRSGVFFDISIKSVHKDESFDENYIRGNTILRLAESFDKHTVSIKAEWGDELSDVDDLPVHESFKLGGPLRLSGVFLDQLSGSDYDFYSLNYYVQYSNLPSQMGRGIYIGTSLESGKINDPFLEDPNSRIDTASLYWAADTVLGVLFLGYGYSDLGQRVWYLAIGPHIW